AGEMAPGFGGPTLSHTAALDAAIVRALDLERHGLRILRPDATVCAPTADGRAIVLWRDVARAVESIRAQSPHDADSYPKFLDSFARISRVIRAIPDAPPPRLDAP